MTEATPDLTLLLRLTQDLTTSVSALSDEMRVQGAILMRVDGTLAALVNEMRATHAQMSRMQDRLRRLEESRP